MGRKKGSKGKGKAKELSESEIQAGVAAFAQKNLLNNNKKWKTWDWKQCAVEIGMKEWQEKELKRIFAASVAYERKKNKNLKKKKKKKKKASNVEKPEGGDTEEDTDDEGDQRSSDQEDHKGSQMIGTQAIHTQQDEDDVKSQLPETQQEGKKGKGDDDDDEEEEAEAETMGTDIEDGENRESLDEESAAEDEEDSSDDRKVKQRQDAKGKGKMVKRKYENDLLSDDKDDDSDDDGESEGDMIPARNTRLQRRKMITEKKPSIPAANTRSQKQNSSKSKSSSSSSPAGSKRARDQRAVRGKNVPDSDEEGDTESSSESSDPGTQKKQQEKSKKVEDSDDDDDVSLSSSSSSSDDNARSRQKSPQKRKSSPGTPSSTTKKKSPTSLGSQRIVRNLFPKKKTVTGFPKKKVIPLSKSSSPLETPISSLTALPPSKVTTTTTTTTTTTSAKSTLAKSTSTASSQGSNKVKVLSVSLSSKSQRMASPSLRRDQPGDRRKSLQARTAASVQDQYDGPVVPACSSPDTEPDSSDEEEDLRTTLLKKNAAAHQKNSVKKGNPNTTTVSASETLSALPASKNTSIPIVRKSVRNTPQKKGGTPAPSRKEEEEKEKEAEAVGSFSSSSSSSSASRGRKRNLPQGEDSNDNGEEDNGSKRSRVGNEDDSTEVLQVRVHNGEKLWKIRNPGLNNGNPVECTTNYMKSHHCIKLLEFLGYSE